MWTSDIAHTGQGGVRKFSVFSDSRPLSSQRAWSELESNAGFREYLTELILRSSPPAFRFETPPLSLSNLSRPFEFVLSDDPGLEVAPDQATFSGYFTGANQDAEATVVSNLSNTALLVVPRQIADPAVYSHFGAFLRGAPPHQVHVLWQQVAQTVQRHWSTGPLWVSTAGGGVAWLHVRIENTPKYYSYRPYARTE